MSDSRLLRIEDLTRRDRSTGRAILDGVNLSIDHGERVGLVGKSGSGKSSLLRAIALLDACEQGSVVFRDAIVSRESIPGFRRQVIYLPQRPSLFPGSLRENLRLPFQLAVSRQQYDESIVAGLLTDLGKPISILDQSVESLSGGEQQIAALIRAIILSPIILLLDEPSASLDPNTTSQLEALVLKWQRQDDGDSTSPRALIWTSHNAEQISRMTTRVVQIDHGKLQSGASG